MASGRRMLQNFSSLPCLPLSSTLPSCLLVPNKLLSSSLFAHTTPSCFLQDRDHTSLHSPSLLFSCCLTKFCLLLFSFTISLYIPSAPAPLHLSCRQARSPTLGTMLARSVPRQWARVCKMHNGGRGDAWDWWTTGGGPACALRASVPPLIAFWRYPAQVRGQAA